MLVETLIRKNYNEATAVDGKNKKSLLKFYKNKHKIPGIVIDFLDDDNVIYGARAMNKQLPDYLRVHTFDVDASSPNPEEEAKMIEEKLDKYFGEDLFYVKAANHPGTFKVKNRATDEGVADLTKVPEPIPFVTIDGKKYSTQEYSLSKIDQSLASDDEASLWRRDKDLSAKQRILLGREEKLNRKLERLYKKTK